MPHALVTGANGFIGTHLVRHLLSRGYTVAGLVRSTSDVRGLAGLPLSLHVGDITQPETLDAPMAGADVAFHLAASLMGLDEETFMRTNVDGTRNVLDAARRQRGGRLTRFLYVSSQAAAGPAPGTTPIDESRPCQPISWYGESKSRAESLVLEYGRDLPVTIVRPASVYGERERDVAQVFPAVERRIQPIVGWRMKYLVMVDVEDLVRGFVDAAESANSVGKIYFLMHPQILTTRDVTRTVAQAMDRSAGVPLPVPIAAFTLAAPAAQFVTRFTRDRPAITRDKAREVAQRFWLADPSASARDFGWAAQHDLLAGMRRTTSAWRGEEATERDMPLEPPAIRWVKYLCVATLIGALIELQSYLAAFYTFTPWWLVFVVIVGAFGLGLGSVAMLLRRSTEIVQLAAGTAIATAVEMLNVVAFHAWTFKPGWPFGITSPWIRSVVLGLAGGAFVLVVNAVMLSLYRLRLRKG